MSQSWRRVLWLLSGLPFLLCGLAFIYMLLMDGLEQEPRTFVASLLWAAETITSVGYGGDSHWDHPVVAVFVVSTQFLGQCLVFVVFPMVLLPFLEERFETRLPGELPRRRDFVLVYRHGFAVEAILDDLRQQEVAVVVLESDERVARRLHERGVDVVFASFEDHDIDLSQVQAARAVILNGSDEDNAALAMQVRQQGYTGPMYAFVDEASHGRPMLLAGATATFTPKHVLAAGLAAKASDAIAPRVSGLRPLGERLEVEEFRVHRDSSLAGRTLGQADVRSVTGATVIGVWQRGGFSRLPSADTRLETGSILLAVGDSDALARLQKLARVLPRRGKIVVIGNGRVGERVVVMLRDAGEETVVIDHQSRAGVDVVGDALSPELLVGAGVRAAKAIVLAIDSGSPTLLATALLRDLAPDVPIVARVDRTRDITRVHQAGADFAISVGQVASQLLTGQLSGESTMVLEAHLRFVAARPGGIAGLGLAQTRIRERTGAAVVAVGRGDQILVQLSGSFVFDADDVLYVCGAEDAIAKFREAFPDVASSREETSAGAS
ncbi:MAG: hypothetical protein B7733_19170 [Myxococcales bacterium FL481]|nr:MAG: hypothetical protein B7733_19170 [Myxococcales bacterium FL481]